MHSFRACNVGHFGFPDQTLNNQQEGRLEPRSECLNLKGVVAEAEVLAFTRTTTTTEAQSGHAQGALPFKAYAV